MLTNAGPECLPLLLAQLTTSETPLKISVHRQIAFMRRWAYARGWTDIEPLPCEDEREVRRGQALTAILLLKNRAKPLVPKLAEIAAQDRNDAVTRAARHALWNLDPDEFRRVRSPAARSPTSQPTSATVPAR